MNFNPLFLDKLTVSDNAVVGAAAKKGQQSYLFSDIIKLCEEEINSETAIDGNAQPLLFPNDSFSIPVNKTTIDDSVLKDILGYIQNYIDKDPGKLNFNSDKYQLDSAVLIKKSFMLSENDIQSFVGGLIDKLQPAEAAGADAKDVNEKREKVLMTLLSALPNNESVDLKFKGNEINLTVIFSKTADSENDEAQFSFNQIKPLKFFKGTIIEQKVGKNDNSSADGTDTAADILQTEFPFEQKGIKNTEVGNNPADAGTDTSATQNISALKPDPEQAGASEDSVKSPGPKSVSDTDKTKAAESEIIKSGSEKTDVAAVDPETSADGSKVFKVEVIETNFEKQIVEEKTPTIIPIDKYPAAETSAKQNPEEPVNILPINKDTVISGSAESAKTSAEKPVADNEKVDKNPAEKTEIKIVKPEQKIFRIEDASIAKTEPKQQNVKIDIPAGTDMAKDVSDLKNLSERNFNLNNILAKETENQNQTAPRSEAPKTAENQTDVKNAKDSVKNSADVKIETAGAQNSANNFSSDLSNEQSNLDSRTAPRADAALKNQTAVPAHQENADAVKQPKNVKENVKEAERVENTASKNEIVKELPRQQTVEANKLSTDHKLNNVDAMAEKAKLFTEARTQETVKVIQAAEIVNEISRFVQKNEKQSMTFQLHPENLGKVQLRVDVQENKINTYIEVENTQVKQAIQSNIDNLKQNLQNAGMQLNNVNVSLSGSDQKFAKSGQFKKKSFGGKAVKLETEQAAVRQKNLGYNTYEYLI